jgi:chromosomal replication initiator protein
MLRSKFGDDKFASWFGKVTIKSETPDVVTLEAPTGFIRDYIRTHFATDVLQVWQSISPNVARVEIVTRQARGNQ